MNNFKIYFEFIVFPIDANPFKATCYTTESAKIQYEILSNDLCDFNIKMVQEKKLDISKEEFEKLIKITNGKI